MPALSAALGLVQLSFPQESHYAAASRRMNPYYVGRHDSRPTGILECRYEQD
jgi:hypothetical protein